MPSASVILSNINGGPITNQSALNWAWFDAADPGVAVAPSDVGGAGATDGQGVLSVSIPNTGLSAGQTGLLAVATSDRRWYGAYNIEVDGSPARAVFAAPEGVGGMILAGAAPTSPDQCVLESPEHASGGCIFAEPSEIIAIAVTRKQSGGGGGLNIRKGRGLPANNRLQQEEDDIMIILAAITETMYG